MLKPLFGGERGVWGDWVGTDRTEEKKAACSMLVQKQNNGSHQKNLKKFPLKAYRKHRIFHKKGSQNDYLSFSDIYFFYDQPLMLK